jgi:Flp pilus assembly pilin Flp
VDAGHGEEGRLTCSGGSAEVAKEKLARSRLTSRRARKGGDRRLTFHTLLKSEEGQAIAEYALLFSLITLALIGACTALGVSVEHVYAAIRDALP